MIMNKLYNETNFKTEYLKDKAGAHLTQITQQIHRFSNDMPPHYIVITFNFNSIDSIESSSYEYFSALRHLKGTSFRIHSFSNYHKLKS